MAVKNKDLPLISVVVPFYKDFEFISDCLSSIRTQNRANWEIVAVDDCGGDGSADIVRAARDEDDRIRLIRHHENQGLAASRNTGVAFARGELVTFLDADDFIFATSLVQRARCLVESTSSLGSDIAGSYCGWEMVPEEADLSFEPTSKAKNRHLRYLDTAGENPLIATAPMLWRKVVLDVGGFDESFRTAEDFEFWMRLLRQGYELVPTGRVGVAYRQKRSGMISDGLAMHARNADRVYDYIHRALEPDEISERAPAAFRRPLAEHQRMAGWIRRLTIFITLAEGAGNAKERNELLALLPPEANIRDLESSNAIGSIGSGIKRYELRHGELSEAEREDLTARTYDRLVVGISTRSHEDVSPRSNGLRFELDTIRARATEEAVNSPAMST